MQFHNEAVANISLLVRSICQLRWALVLVAAWAYPDLRHGTGQEVASSPQSQPATMRIQEIIAHRGSSADRPENTIASARRAVEAGATAIEIDLRTTLDGHLIILHDSSVERTTDGQGDVGRLTLAQVRALDAGSKFSEKFKGERIPTFDELLHLAKNSKVKLLLDLKESGPAYTEKIVSLVKQSEIEKQIILGVRSETQARDFRRLLPGCEQLGFIPTQDRIESFHDAGVNMIRLWSTWLDDPTLVARVRKTGAKLHINLGRGTLEEVTSIMRHRPDAILCDDPALALQSLSSLAVAKPSDR